MTTRRPHHQLRGAEEATHYATSRPRKSRRCSGRRAMWSRTKSALEEEAEQEKRFLKQQVAMFVGTSISGPTRRADARHCAE